jgi:isopenicillin N synthase-like dioxygenase
MDIQHKIPVIDCNGHSVINKSSEIISAIETVGFVYLKNCGFDFRKITDMNREMMKFWQLSDREKSSLSRGSFAENVDHGYVGNNRESLGKLTEQVQQLASFFEKFNVAKCNYVIKMLHTADQRKQA